MKKFLKSFGFYLIIFAVLLVVVSFVTQQQVPDKKIYSELVTEIRNGQVTELQIIEDTAVAKLRNNTKVEVPIYSYAILQKDVGDVINQQIDSGVLKVDIKSPQTMPWWVSFLPPLILIILVIVVYFFFMNQAQGGGGAGRAMSFGKVKAKTNIDDENRVTFNDVAGADEEKEELVEIVDFLKTPDKFVKLGARIPKGVLLVGPPGTGKTLLARAVAGEARVPFFTISGSDFVEMFVGVGASRVRDLFEQAKKNSPSIIFIDEIDAVGRHRGSGLGGGHDEREQTLNQLLVEMDGFGKNQGVIVMAATNRVDILDPALLRPGRFDRQVYVGYPDQKGREAILNVHSRGKTFGDDVSFEVVSKTTYGFTGADLENLLNEAALLSARKNKNLINMPEIDEAMLKVIMGPEKKSRVMKEKVKEMTAYHEAGHAVVTKLLPEQDPVHQVSIIPRGRAGGFTLSLPDTDKAYVSKTEMEQQLIILMGGRVAEKIIFGEINTGASSDIERATSIAKDMVTKYGMSDKLGSLTFGENSNEVFIGRDLGHTRTYSETTATEIDAEIKKIVDTAYEACEKLLMDNLDKLHAVAKALIEHEKLDGDEFLQVFETGKLLKDAPSVSAFEEPKEEGAEDAAEASNTELPKD